ncbi:tryptophan synthase subunit alpha [Aquibacillus koreensis]|uniref:Tryptophan synthase alpha chain n=1 Tax=Aquibacillus koreensis TaxID=279446 RepID=A0A9X4AJX3_9BACI|nr:tryptophan synthase subunit alpha [Aquibacillus koreensis]MCT2538191.1 tryptophan synthase subunit alpha [Aquibacillus koreensis]MDC3420865.1 tryptophan synthase subunit alpha [Aquibacillus koreensis]
MGKQKMDQAFETVLARGDKAFVPYIMAGDGGLDRLDEDLAFLEESGATVVELGIPFSDPVADGPTIQEAGLRALAEGVSLRSVLEKLKESSQTRTIPIVLMTYINPIYAFGVKEFAKACDEAGVDGLIIPDMPMEEEPIIANELTAFNIALIRLAALTSPKERLVEIAKRTEGFLYAVTVTGTTGARTSFKENLAGHLQDLKELASVPVLAGFGVSTAEHVEELTKSCDGVVVGSRIVDLLHKGEKDTLRELIQSAKLSEKASL